MKANSRFNIIPYLFSAAAALFSAAVFAVPQPPVIDCGDDCTVAPPGPGEVLYDLGELPDFLSDLRWPQPPDEGNVITLTDSGAFNASCTGCTYDARGATINGTLTFSGQRIRWLGGQLNGRIVNTGAQDVAIVGLNQTAVFEHNDFSGRPNGLHRWAIVSSSFVKPPMDPFNHDGWLFYNSPGTDYDNRDVILADVLINNGAGQTVRMQKIENLVIVDSALNPEFTASNGIRVTCGSTDVLIRDTNISGGTTSAPDEPDPRCPTRYNITRGQAERVTWASNLSNTFQRLSESPDWAVIDSEVVPAGPLDPGSAGVN